MSLDDTVGKEHDTPISDYLADDDCINAENELIHREASTMVVEAIRYLNEQEKTVVCYRFGMLGVAPLTLKQTGNIMKISRERVRQIECQAKTRLRRFFAGRRMVKSPPKRPWLGPNGKVLASCSFSARGQAASWRKRS